MKRSEINQIIREGDAFLKANHFYLPPFAYWTPEDWATKGEEADEIRDNNLGWDITDYGTGRFEQTGLFLFTIRNGNLDRSRGGGLIARYPKPYAEKIMIVRENQLTPYHFHWKKMEEIINRGGGRFLIKVYNANAGEQLADTDVEVHLDGVRKMVPAGTVICLEPGESICLFPYQYHSFWSEPGRGPCLVGEVSMVNDDNTDNRFLKPVARFTGIEEDEAPLHYLVGEYPACRA